MKVIQRATLRFSNMFLGKTSEQVLHTRLANTGFNATYSRNINDTDTADMDVVCTCMDKLKIKTNKCMKTRSGLEMNRLKMVIFMVFFGLLSMGSRGNAATGYAYKVFVYSGDVNKELFGSIRSKWPMWNVRLEEDNYQFFSMLQYSDSLITSTFFEQGIHVLSVERTTFKAPEPSEVKLGGTDCGVAQLLCSNTSLSGSPSGHGVQELNYWNHGCLYDNEHQSSWYYLNVQSGGSLNMRINPNSNWNDYDFAIWGPFTSATAAANCPPTSSPVRCSYAQGTGNTGMNGSSSDVSEGIYGNGWIAALNTNASEVYILLIDNYSSGAGYALDFSWGSNVSSTVLGCTPIVLPVEITSFTGSRNGINNLLKWQVESETDNDYYLLETTQNPGADNWSLVEKVYSKGNTTHGQVYTSVHHAVLKGINYYRLTQVDKNGQQRVYNELVVIDPDTVGSSGEATVVKRINLLGQEVTETYHGLVILVYSDGTSVKVMQ